MRNLVSIRGRGGSQKSRVGCLDRKTNRGPIRLGRSRFGPGFQKDIGRQLSKSLTSLVRRLGQKVAHEVCLRAGIASRTTTSLWFRATAPAPTRFCRQLREACVYRVFALIAAPCDFLHILAWSSWLRARCPGFARRSRSRRIAVYTRRSRSVAILEVVVVIAPVVLSL